MNIFKRRIFLDPYSPNICVFISVFYIRGCIAEASSTLLRLNLIWFGARPCLIRLVDETQESNPIRLYLVPCFHWRGGGERVAYKFHLVITSLIQGPPPPPEYVRCTHTRDSKEKINNHHHKSSKHNSERTKRWEESLFKPVFQIHLFHSHYTS